MSTTSDALNYYYMTRLSRTIKRHEYDQCVDEIAATMTCEFIEDSDPVAEWCADAGGFSQLACDDRVCRMAGGENGEAGGVVCVCVE